MVFSRRVSVFVDSRSSLAFNLATGSQLLEAYYRVRSSTNPHIIQTQHLHSFRLSQSLIPLKPPPLVRPQSRLTKARWSSVRRLSRVVPLLFQFGKPEDPARTYHGGARPLLTREMRWDSASEILSTSAAWSACCCTYKQPCLLIGEDDEGEA